MTTIKIGSMGRKAVFSAFYQFIGVGSVAVAGAYLLKEASAAPAAAWLLTGGAVVAVGLGIKTYFSIKKMSRWMGGAGCRDRVCADKYGGW